MDQGEFLRRLDEINTWRRHGQRAPHKPLLLLLALGRLQQGKKRLAFYERDIREQLHDLLRSYGPPRKSYRPEYPFWHLRSDELWEIPDDDLATIKGGRETSPTDRQLVDLAVRGGLPEPVYRLLDGNPELIQRAAQKILEGHFPSSLRRPIRDAVGLLESVAIPAFATRSLQRMNDAALSVTSTSGSKMTWSRSTLLTSSGTPPEGLTMSGTGWRCASCTIEPSTEEPSGLSGPLVAIVCSSRMSPMARATRSAISFATTEREFETPSATNSGQSLTLSTGIVARCSGEPPVEPAATRLRVPRLTGPESTL